MKAMEKLLLALMMMAVATPTLAANDGIEIPRALRMPVETVLTFECMHVVPEDEAIYVGSGLGRVDLIIIQNQAYRELFAICG